MQLGVGGLGLAGPLRLGDWCSLHWDWACDRLDRARLVALRRYTLAQLDAAGTVLRGAYLYAEDGEIRHF